MRFKTLVIKIKSNANGQALDAWPFLITLYILFPCRR